MHMSMQPHVSTWTNTQESVLICAHGCVLWRKLESNTLSLQFSVPVMTIHFEPSSNAITLLSLDLSFGASISPCLQVPSLQCPEVSGSTTLSILPPLLCMVSLLPEGPSQAPRPTP